MESGREVWPRDPKKAKQAIKQAEFKCEIDDTHETFVSEASRKKLYGGPSSNTVKNAT